MGGVKVRITIFLIAIFIALAGCTPGDSIKKEPMVKTYADPKICMGEDKDCVLEVTAFNDALVNKSNLYLGRNLSLSNIDSHPSLDRVVASIKYQQDGDTYAIFLVEHMLINNGSPDLCHACTPYMSVVVYQFHNSWKLFATKLITDFDIGSWGYYNSKPDDIKILPAGKEHFYLALSNRDGGQGISIDTTEFIGVMSNLIQNFGLIQTGYDDCGSDIKMCTPWTSSYELKSENGNDVIYLNKKFKDGSHKIRYEISGIKLQKQNTQ